MENTQFKVPGSFFREYVLFQIIKFSVKRFSSGLSNEQSSKTVIMPCYQFSFSLMIIIISQEMEYNSVFCRGWGPQNVNIIGHHFAGQSGNWIILISHLFLFVLLFTNAISMRAAECKHGPLFCRAWRTSYCISQEIIIVNENKTPNSLSVVAGPFAGGNWGFVYFTRGQLGNWVMLISHLFWFLLLFANTIFEDRSHSLLYLISSLLFLLLDQVCW